MKRLDRLPPFPFFLAFLRRWMTTFAALLLGCLAVFLLLALAFKLLAFFYSILGGKGVVVAALLLVLLAWSGLDAWGDLRGELRQGQRRRLLYDFKENTLIVDPINE